MSIYSTEEVRTIKRRASSQGIGLEFVLKYHMNLPSERVEEQRFTRIQGTYIRECIEQNVSIERIAKALGTESHRISYYLSKREDNQKSNKKPSSSNHTLNSESHKKKEKNHLMKRENPLGLELEINRVVMYGRISGSHRIFEALNNLWSRGDYISIVDLCGIERVPNSEMRRASSILFGLANQISRDCSLYQEGLRKYASDTLKDLEGTIEDMKTIAERFIALVRNKYDRKL